MSFRKIGEEVTRVIRELPTRPTGPLGKMTTAQLKAKFDQAASAVAAYVCDLIDELQSENAAGEIGFRATAGVNEDTVQKAIENVQRQLQDVALESVPDGSINANKLADSAVTGPKIAGGSVTREKFDSDTWTLVYEKYAVGDIFVTMRAGDPAELLGYGTWSQIRDRFLLAAGVEYTFVGRTGGESVHTLTTDEMPQHEHRFPRQNWYAQDSLYGEQAAYTTYTWDHSDLHAEQACIGPAGTYAPVGGGLPHNNMPPFMVVAMWIRIA